MAQASVTIDILAQIKGYEASLSKLKAQASKIDIGSSIGKQLTSAIKQAETALKGLSKNGLEKAVNDNQINSIIDKTNRAGQMIQQVAMMMQQIGVNDINFGSFNSGIQEMTAQLQALQTQLNNTIESGMQKMITSSQDLSTAFQSLNIDTKGKSTGQIYDELGKKAQQAAAQVTQANAQLAKAEANLTSKQATVSKLQANPLNNRQQFEQELKVLVDSYSTSLSKIKSQVDQKVKGMLGNNEQGQKIVDNFFSGLNVNNLRERLTNLRIQMQNALQASGFGEVGARDIFSQIFGGLVDNKAPNAGNLTTQLRGTIQEIENARALIMSKINEVAPDLTQAQVGKLFGFLSKDQLNNFVSEFSKDAEKAAERIAGALIQARQRAAQALTQRNTAEQKVETAQVTQNTVSQLERQLQAENERLRNENQALQQQISNLQGQVTQKQQDTAAAARGVGKTEMQSVQQLQFSAQAAARYSAELQKASQAQQMMGKIQGVVQRWFSIYTVIRAIGNAIRQVTSTIQEIDSTITDIAIVTNQSQDDLWGQMKTYSKMAKDYAASVSGVYKVSQIYYQQGLQTADVMALTEQTLKMARISGLDYATSADYMTNAIRSFKMEMTDAERVVDVYSSIAASSASSVEQLSTAMSKTASSAQAVGSSFESTTAMMAVMIEATRQSAQNIGSAMKSIISRYGEMTKNPTSLIDAEGQEMSLNRVDTALQSVGISIHDSEGQFRSFSDVIMELAQKWQTIDTNTQRYGIPKFVCC